MRFFAGRLALVRVISKTFFPPLVCTPLFYHAGRPNAIGARTSKNIFLHTSAPCAHNFALFSGRHAQIRPSVCFLRKDMRLPFTRDGRPNPVCIPALCHAHGANAAAHLRRNRRSPSRASPPIGARKKPGAARFARVGLSLYFVFFMRAFAAILFFMVQPLCSMAAPTKPENSGCGRFGRDLNSG